MKLMPPHRRIDESNLCTHALLWKVMFTHYCPINFLACEVHELETLRSAICQWVKLSIKLTRHSLTNWIQCR